MRNKELKKGDKVWICAEHESFENGLPILKVSKKGTLVTVVAEAKNYIGKRYEITLYGHASSSILSGFDRMFCSPSIFYTCNYDIIVSRTERYDRKEKFCNAGIALLNLAKYFKS